MDEQLAEACFVLVVCTETYCRRFKTFDSLAQAIADELWGRVAILDGEIVRPGPDGRPMF